MNTQKLYTNSTSSNPLNNIVDFLMGWFGVGGGGGDGHVGDTNSSTVAQLEQQIEMMDMVFIKAIKQCGTKCIPSQPYKDGELNKGESVCVQRCLNKFFDVLEVVSQQLAEVGMQNQNAQV